MTIRKGHGSGAGQPRIEVLPADEQPAGVPAPARPAAGRDDAGRFAPGPGTRELARRAAAAKHEARQLRQLLGLQDVPEGHSFHPYLRVMREWRDQQSSHLAETCGGGEVGPGAALIVATAALQFAASRWCFDLGIQTGDPGLLKEGSRFGDSARQNILAAREIVVRDAQQRPRDDGALHSALLAEFGADD